MRTLVRCMAFLIVISWLCFGAYADDNCTVNGTEFPLLSEQISIQGKASVSKIINELKQLPNLQSVSWSGITLSFKHILQLKEAFPQVFFDCTFACFKSEYNTGMTYAKISTNKMMSRDLYNFLAVMSNLEKLDLFSLRISVAKMEELFEAYPSISFGWRVPVPNRANRTVRSDATAFSTLHRDVKHRFGSEEFDLLRYCPNMLALDLGHNKIDDVSFLKYFPHLKVLILADNQISDLSELVSFVPELEYLELFINQISDISPLASLKYLRHLNIAHNQVKDLSPILEMPQLIRCWVAYNPFPEEQAQRLKDAMPDTHFEFAAYWSTDKGWRKPSKYYEAIYKMFRNYTYIPLPD